MVNSHKIYTECLRCSGTTEYLGKYAFLRKMFETKVAGYKVMYLMMLTVWSWVASPGQSHIDCFKRNALLIPESS